MEQNSLPTAGELFANAGGYESSFKQGTPVGTVVSGEVTNVEALQVKNYDTDELEWWEPGRPKMQMRIVVQTGVLDSSIENDTGERAIYIKWWGDQRTALMAAVKAAGAKGVEVGGKFAAKFLGTKPTTNSSGKKLNDSKIFGYQYQAPVQGVDFGQMGEPAPQAQPQQAATPQSDPWGQQAPAQAAPQQVQAQQNLAQGLGAQPIQQQSQPPQQAPQAQPQQAATPQSDPWGQQAQAGQDDPRIAQAQQLLPLGFDNQQISAATGLTPDQVQALRS